MMDVMNSFIPLFLISQFITAGVGAYFASYLREKGRNFATREDIEKIEDQVKRTTQAAEEIKAQISGSLSIQQKRFDAKLECYSKLALAIILLQEACDQGDHDKVNAQLSKINEFSSTARIFVTPTVRTLLTKFGNRINGAAGDLREMERIAHRYWLAVLDVAREDLFGEPREWTNEEALA